ncbi:MAG TPA: lytic murein transglycosylase B [Burkholderiales bacterium]|nr:lytic murein transglycosylase B [Burkholderiales bacterium]
MALRPAPYPTNRLSPSLSNKALRLALALLAALAQAAWRPALAQPHGGHAAVRKAAPRSAATYAGREDVRAFIEAMVDRHGFRRDELDRLFAKARYQPSIVRAMQPPQGTPAPSWQSYRPMFVNAERIAAGRRFQERYATVLARAEAEFGVPAEIVTAIIGVETIYGRNTGRYRVVDALATLAFDYPPRAAYFRQELEYFLLLARETGVDAIEVKGSYAGAMGMPQFMPGSTQRFALDYDGDGRTDLTSAVDSIGSVANFLAQHGWQRGGAIALSVRVAGARPVQWLDAGIKPSLRVPDLTTLEFTSAPPVADPEELVTLVELPSDPPEYRLGFNNFYVLTRYNRSSMYAMAVMDLAEALRVPTLPAPALVPAAGLTPASAASVESQN